MGRPTVLISGCSRGGIGDALAREFASRGYHVFAGLRDLGKTNDYSSINSSENVPGTIELVKLDIASTQSIRDLAEKLSSRLPEGKLDILINNAAISASGPAADADIDNVRRLYETNVFGPLTMTQAFLPMLIAAKGKLVNISSIGSLVNSPWFGIYTSSKAALTNMSETLRLELAPLGVTVVTGMIGLVKTNLPANDSYKGLPESSYYKSMDEHIKYILTSDMGHGQMDVDDFARTFISDVVGGASGMVWRGSGAQKARFFGYHFPARIVDSMVISLSGINKMFKGASPTDK